MLISNIEAKFWSNSDFYLKIQIWSLQVAKIDLVYNIEESELGFSGRRVQKFNPIFDLAPILASNSTFPLIWKDKLSFSKKNKVSE